MFCVACWGATLCLVRVPVSTREQLGYAVAREVFETVTVATKPKSLEGICRWHQRTDETRFGAAPKDETTLTAFLLFSQEREWQGDAI